MGDTFNQWYDQVIWDIQRETKCVEDMAGWADSLDLLFKDMGEFLSVTGNHGIIRNLEKFVWCQHELESWGSG